MKKSLSLMIIAALATTFTVADAKPAKKAAARVSKEDAELLKLDFPQDEDWEYPVNTNEYVCERIDKQPTADVQEIKHGHWIMHEEWFEDEPKPRMVKACSVCKQSIKSNHDALNFCINCGAKMDEEINNES